MRLPEFQPRSDWRPPDVSSLPSWAGAKRIGIDIETKDPQLTTLGPGVRRDGRIVGVSFAIEDGPKAYLPIGHLIGPNLDPAVVFRYLRDQAKATKAIITGANLQYDMDYLAEQGVEFWHCEWRDVQNAEPIIDELQMSYSLENIAARHGLPGKDESHLYAAARAWGVDPKAGLWQLSPIHVGAYAEQDGVLPLQLLRRQESVIEREDLWKVFKLECRLQPVLLKMRRRGVRVDFDKLEQVETWCLSREAAALHEITRQTGIQLSTEDTTKTSALAPVIRHLGFPVPQTADKHDSLTKDYLATLKHPVADLIREARKFNKVRTTFAASVREHAVKGRIHCTFNQLRTSHGDDGDDEGARYGRLSCVDPNLQQQPARDKEIGPRWRSVYVPDEGGRWSSLDYSQQEPRWLTHYAELLALDKGNSWSDRTRERAIAAADRYRNDPTTDNHQMMADLCGIPRTPAKEIYLGKCYGMGGAKMCRKLGLPTEWRVKWKQQWLPLDSQEGKDALANGGFKLELAGPAGKAIIDKFDEGAPFVKELSYACERKAKNKGFIITAGGRRCRFPVGPKGFEWAHKALNRLIQGSSGDQTKQAMVTADEANIPLQLQVHDELDLTTFSDAEEDQLEKIMKEALPCRVPAKVDVEHGPSWGEIE